MQTHSAATGTKVTLGSRRDPPNWQPLCVSVALIVGKEEPGHGTQHLLSTRGLLIPARERERESARVGMPVHCQCTR